LPGKEVSPDMTFRLSHSPLDPESLKDEVRSEGCGACVSFEGWVRNENEGRAVEQLEYEAYDRVALKEGSAIVAEALRRFGAHGALCVHRVGPMAVGACAVWVGVSTPHRSEGFAACRYIIDEIKHRVPIWKKEHYVGGDSEWVNCARCAHGAGAADHDCTHGEHGTREVLTPENYYSRQTILAELGPMGQQCLAAAKVLVVGAGGLGSPVLAYLAGAGVGTIGIAEEDLLEGSNLHRQFLYGVEDLGKPKAVQAANRLRSLNPFITVHAHSDRVTEKNIETLLANYDLILDCCDNFETKFLLNDGAVTAGKPLIHASIYQYEGQLFAWRPGEDLACLRCIWPETPAPDCVGSCAEAGILGAVAGALGSMQALEALKQLLDLPGKLGNGLLLVDLLSHRSRAMKMQRNSDCPCCGTQARPLSHPLPAEASVEVAGVALGGGGYRWVDMRELSEGESVGVEYMERLPASAWADAPTFPKDERILLVCARGMRSRFLAKRLRAMGYGAVYSLRHGLEGLEQLAQGKH